MSTPNSRSPSSQSQPVPTSSSPASYRGRSSYGQSPSRAASTARLAGSPYNRTPDFRQTPSTNGIVYDGTNENIGNNEPLAGVPATSSLPGPGVSALATALSRSRGTPPPQNFGTPPARPFSPAATGSQLPTAPTSNYGSFDTRSRSGPAWSGYEDPDIVRRHLVQPNRSEQNYRDIQDGGFGPGSWSMGADGSRSRRNESSAPEISDDEFSSLRLQGGDITRPIYKWTEEQERSRRQRSQSFSLSRPEPEHETMDIGSIKVPGGFRRDYIRRAAGDCSPDGDIEGGSSSNNHGTKRPQLFTNNFIEFLSIYGHFAGMELEEDDEDLEPDEFFGSEDWDDRTAGEGSDDDREPMEDSALLTPGRRRRKRREVKVKRTNGQFNAALLLTKSFVGTGVLFLPKAYLNGGMLFSNIILLFVAVLSYYCFVLLVNTSMKVEGGFGDMGGKLYGKWMRTTILFSIVISQIGFVAAYIVFTSENLQAFFLAVSNCKLSYPVQYFIFIQMIIFLPFSLIRDISKLGATALIAEVFIVIGLIYLYYYDILTLVNQGGIADIINFNPNDWTLFIGTAIFTFEGIGLIIPIQESMREPTKFPRVLAYVMVIISVIFISMGAISYAAYGSKTETVVILNLPQDSKMVNVVQFLYSMAILLSTPLQIFPAIRIMETGLFTRSGKYNPNIKWQKNGFRFLVVALCAAIAWGGASDLDKFVSLVGTFACVPLVYIYPPMLHYRAVATSRLMKIADVVLCIFGAIVMAYTTSLTVANWANGGGEGLPKYCDGDHGTVTVPIATF